MRRLLRILSERPDILTHYIAFFAYLVIGILVINHYTLTVWGMLIGSLILATPLFLFVLHIIRTAIKYNW
jgi:hypothetical protein